ncbi:glycosyltransferase family 2 protein [Microbacteriaceae bacterium VKM Ac-2855]|nr:glycosyltransferase family 2 protein [Microbacteriaceae bacterium VKM Ac-2855]
MRCVVVTIASEARRAHLLNQLALLGDVPVVVVWLDAEPARDIRATTLLHVPPGADGMRLAAARNAGADAALALGAELLVFLDADCVPGAELFDRYRSAAVLHSDAVLCGPVTYLAEGENVYDRRMLDVEADPHPARPNPADGVVQLASGYELFWSLSFALTADTWRRGPRFDEAYEGYGAEDTDFAFAQREAGRRLAWVGGAHAHHQWHPTAKPPWQHLDDILRNGARFAERWQVWPMRGWLEAFATAGAVVESDGAWRRTERPRP